MNVLQAGNLSETTAPSQLATGNNGTAAGSRCSSETAVFDDTVVALLTPLDVTQIRDRWLDYYFTPTTKQIKQYPARVMALISRTLATYTTMWIRNQSHIPPIIHTAQCDQATNLPESLANCLSLLRLSENSVPGSDSLVRDSVRREMTRLVRLVEDGVQTRILSQQFSSLCALQAYLLLSMHAYFTGKGRPDLGIFTPDLITTLHDMTSKVSAAGIMCSEETGATPVSNPEPAGPRWETWILAEAKRRTVFTVYMFEDVYNHDNGATTYLAEELAALPAPACKWTWNAKTRSSFEAEYSDWTRSWGGTRRLAISELWPRPVGLDVVANEAKEMKQECENHERESKWAEGVDEFGMLLLAVCTTTHNV